MIPSARSGPTTLIDLASRPIHTPTARSVDRFARVRPLYSRGKQL